MKISALSAKIHINNNWTAAKTAGICTGNGIYSDPYIIEDLIIDGGGSGYCIKIEYSNVYFKVENCTVYNSGYISLTLVDNGLLVENNCSKITLGYSNNNTIFGNIVSGGNYCIASSHCNNLNIMGNKVYNNWNGYNGRGISLFDTYNSSISQNIVEFQRYSVFDSGIHLDNCTSVNVLKNDIYECRGIVLENSLDNYVKENNLMVTKWEPDYNMRKGIYVFESHNNSIIGNLLNNHSRGINLWFSNDNLISNNIFTNNDYGIYLDVRCKSNVILNNTFVNCETNVFQELPSLPFIFPFILTLISVMIVLIVIAVYGEFTIRKKSGIEPKRLPLPIRGIASLGIELLGLITYTIASLYFGITFLMYGILILIPFSIIGIACSKSGLREDDTKFMAKFGLILGWTLLIISLLPGILILIFIIIMLFLSSVGGVWF